MALDLLNLQRKMLSSSLVAKDGALNFTNPTSFIPVIYENESPSEFARTASPLTSYFVPSSSRVPVLFTHSEGINTLNGIRVSPQYQVLDLQDEHERSEELPEDTEVPDHD